MVLVVINLLITLQFAYFPNVTAAVKNRWAQYQQKREREAAVKKALAVEQQAMSFSDPPGTVVWEEDPAKAAPLLAGSGYAKIEVNNLAEMPLLSNWPRGAAAVTPAILKSILPNESRRLGNDAVLLLHGMRSPSGQERLVYVYLFGGLDLNESNARSRFERLARRTAEVPLAGTFTVDKQLMLIAGAYLPGGGEKPPEPVQGAGASLLIHGFGTDAQRMNWHWAPPSGDKPEEIRIDGREVFRFYAGQPDPSDPSRFTIDYDVDGQRGAIRGQLKNDGTLELKPSTGHSVGRQWYPLGSTTRPDAQ
jgi:hypothetical protein